MATRGYQLQAAICERSSLVGSRGQSDDRTLEFFGDVNDDGVLSYVVYSLSAPAGATTVTINGTTYTLYTLYRSITPVTFASGATNNAALPMVQNILCNTYQQARTDGAADLRLSQHHYGWCYSKRLDRGGNGGHQPPRGREPADQGDWQQAGLLHHGHTDLPSRLGRCNRCEPSRREESTYPWCRRACPWLTLPTTTHEASRMSTRVTRRALGPISGFGLSGEREDSIELRPGVWAAALTDVAVVSAGAGGEEGRNALSSGSTPGSGTPRS